MIRKSARSECPRLDIFHQGGMVARTSSPCFLSRLWWWLSHCAADHSRRRRVPADPASAASACELTHPRRFRHEYEMTHRKTSAKVCELQVAVHSAVGVTESMMWLHQPNGSPSASIACSVVRSVTLSHRNGCLVVGAALKQQVAQRDGQRCNHHLRWTAPARRITKNQLQYCCSLFECARVLT